MPARAKAKVKAVTEDRENITKAEVNLKILRTLVEVKALILHTVGTQILIRISTTKTTTKIIKKKLANIIKTSSTRKNSSPR